MKAIRRLLQDERVRFLLVGGFNTLFGYAVFVTLELTVGSVIGYLVSLTISYFLGTIVAFALHRHFTYRKTGTGNVLIDYLRFVSVYLVSLAINFVALPLLVEFAHVPPILAQAMIVVLTTAVSYFGHKFFSFRRKPIATPVDTLADEAQTEA